MKQLLFLVISIILITFSHSEVFAQDSSGQSPNSGSSTSSQNPAATPTPPSTQSQPTEPPHTTQTPLPTTTSHQTLLPLPTQSSTGNTIPPTSQVTPSIESPRSGDSLTGIKEIKIRANPGTVIEISLQPRNLTALQSGSLHIVRLTIPNDKPEVLYKWDTRNHPNGEYFFFAKVFTTATTATVLDPISIKIENQSQTTAQKDTTKPEQLTTPKPSSIVNETSKTQTDSPKVESEPAQTAADIVFPSEFDPKVVPESQTVQVAKIENTQAEDNKTVLTFRGKATPNTIITLLIYSNPIVVTVRTDANGQWTYSLDKPLEPGKHQVYAVVSQSNGRSIRSEVESFFIAPVIAADSEESLVLASAGESSLVNQFIYSTVALIAVSVIAVGFIYYKKRKVLATQPVPVDENIQ